MTTLISYHSSGGDSVRCDARCYDAGHPRCDCICGGANHGAGKQQAVDNCREMAEGWIEKARAAGQDITGVYRDIDTLTEPLFALADLAAPEGARERITA